MSGSASSSSAAIFGIRPSRCATASESRSRAWSRVLGVEDRPDQRRQQPVLVLARVPEAVAQEVDGAALPAAAEDLRDRRLQPGVRVADRELDAGQAALDEASEELGPERLGLGLADVDREDLAPPGLMHAVRDDQRLGDDAAAVADLLHLGVQEQVRVAALQRPRPERLDVLVQRLADAADVGLGDPQPEPLDELVDAPRRDAAAHRPAGRPPAAPARSACAAPGSSGSSCPGAAWGSAARARRPWCPSAAADTRCDASRDPPGRRSPCSAPINSDTSSSIISAATALTASRITSACSSSNTFLTTSSIVILSAPATRRLLSSTPWNETTKDQRRVGRNHVPSDPDLHHATGRDLP